MIKGKTHKAIKEYNTFVDLGKILCLKKLIYYPWELQEYLIDILGLNNIMRTAVEMGFELSGIHPYFSYILALSDTRIDYEYLRVEKFDELVFKIHENSKNGKPD